MGFSKNEEERFSLNIRKSSRSGIAGGNGRKYHMDTIIWVPSRPSYGYHQDQTFWEESIAALASVSILELWRYYHTLNL